LGKHKAITFIEKDDFARNIALTMKGNYNQSAIMQTQYY